MSPISNYLLSKHVFICVTGGYVVLLDLRRDRYMALDAAQARPLVRLVRGWPASDTPVPVPMSSGDDTATAIVRPMIERELLTTDDLLGKDAAPLDIPLPSTTLLQPPVLFGDEAEARSTIRSRPVMGFAAAAVSAAAELKWWTIERVVQDVTHRRMAWAGGTLDMERAKELVALFNRLRPFAFTARQACLFDSLALLNFLAHHKLFPRWVFGVQVAPFSAHCWVQEGTTIFNDTAEHVRHYTPIMAA